MVSRDNSASRRTVSAGTISPALGLDLPRRSMRRIWLPRRPVVLPSIFAMIASRNQESPFDTLRAGKSGISIQQPIKKNDSCKSGKGCLTPFDALRLLPSTGSGQAGQAEPQKRSKADLMQSVRLVRHSWSKGVSDGGNSAKEDGARVTIVIASRCQAKQSQAKALTPLDPATGGTPFDKLRAGRTSSKNLGRNPYYLSRLFEQYEEKARRWTRLHGLSGFFFEPWTLDLGLYLRETF